MAGAFKVSREIAATLCERVGMSSSQGGRIAISSSHKASL
jgi:hypothetical protein